jgi:hypothetical protein
MKKYSDYFSSLSRLQKTGNRIATTALFMLAAVSISFAQDFTFIEGSIHGFSVTDNPANTFAWSMDTDPYNNIDLDPSAYDLIDGGNTNAVTVQFSDMSRSASELVYLVVEEMAPTGCSTKRAIQIQLEPNNMYLDFASLPNADNCFNFDENYYAEVQVGMNFSDRDGVTDSAIPEDRFPLKVKYTVENKTLDSGVNEGNSGDWIVLEYNAANAYTLEVTEAKGMLGETIEYELAITEVVDNYGTAITHDEDRRIQIRIINHLPQSGSMDMAMAYVVTPFSY